MEEAKRKPGAYFLTEPTPLFVSVRAVKLFFVSGGSAGWGWEGISFDSGFRFFFTRVGHERSKHANLGSYTRPHFTRGR